MGIQFFLLLFLLNSKFLRPSNLSSSDFGISQIKYFMISAYLENSSYMVFNSMRHCYAHLGFCNVFPVLFNIIEK